MKQPETPSHEASLPSTIVSNTNKVSMKNSSDRYFDESYAEGAHKPKTNSILIVAIVVSLGLIGVAVAAIGLYLWRKRYSFCLLCMKKILQSWSFHMKFMKRAFGAFHQFHMK